MYDKLNLLGIYVSSDDSMMTQPDTVNTTFWMILFILAILGLAIFIVFLPKMTAAADKSREKRHEKRLAKKREAELERLHHIKKKNKRK